MSLFSKKKKLITSGCSYTANYALSQGLKQVPLWPNLLAEKLGIAVAVERFSANVLERDVENVIYEFNRDPRINGILISLPLLITHSLTGSKKKKNIERQLATIKSKFMEIWQETWL